MAKVSVVIPMHNVGQFVERCIESVISQTYRDLEIIVVNDGSTDNSAEKMMSYLRDDSRITLINQENQGVSSARNKGIDSASGEYITFVDPDDYLEMDAIENMVALIRGNDVDCVRTSWRVLNKGFRRGGDRCANNGLYQGEALRELQYRAAIGDILSYSWVILIKRQAITSSNLGFPEGISMMEDAWFFADMLSGVKSIFISDIVTYNYVVHDAGAVRSIDGFDHKLNSIAEVNRRIVSNPVFNERQRGRINAVYAGSMVNLSIISAMRVGSLTSMYTLFDKVHSSNDFRYIYNKADTSRLMVYYRIICWAAFRDIKLVLFMIVVTRKVCRR